MMSQLYFTDNPKITHLNQLITLAKAIIDEYYEIKTIDSPSNEVQIEFFKDDYEGVISYENGGDISLQLSDTEECIKLFDKIKVVIE